MQYQLSSETEQHAAACVALVSDVTVLKFLTFEQKVQRFHFTSGPTNSVAYSAQKPNE